MGTPSRIDAADITPSRPRWLYRPLIFDDDGIAPVACDVTQAASEP
ncbi:MAG: hypothetical protein QM705_05565 [Ancrocorticia sp.]